MLRVKDLLYQYVTEGPLPLERLMRPIVPAPGGARRPTA